MKLSKYAIVYPNDEKTSLVYSSLSNAIVKIDKQDLSMEEPMELSRRDVTFLTKMKIIEQDDDQANMIKMLHDRKFSDGHLSIWLYITLGCNLKCDYCYEKHIYKKNNSRLNMSFENIKQFVIWCQEYVTANAITKLSLTLTGGEPTTYIPGLNYLIRLLKDENLFKICNFTMITNGYVLDEDAMLFIINYIDVIQITLDGPEWMHDSRRISVDNQPTFKSILRNIIRVKARKNLQLIIRINVDSRNMDHIEELFTVIDKYKLKQEVVLNLGDILDEKQTDSQVLNKILKIYDHCKQDGYNVAICETTPCPISNSGWFAITPDGNLFKCTGMIGSPQYAVGNIASSDWNDEYYRQMNLDAWKDCLDCAVVGICAGGCSYRNYISGNNTAKNCRIKYLLEVLKRQVTESVYQEDNQ